MRPVIPAPMMAMLGIVGGQMILCYGLGECFDIFDFGVGEDAVTEVEDKAVMGGHLVEYF